MKTYVQFERGRDDVWGPLLGPFDWVQLTYGDLRIPEDGDTLAFFKKSGEWELTDLAGEYAGQVYSDLIISHYAEEQAEEFRRLHPVSYSPVVDATEREHP